MSCIDPSQRRSPHKTQDAPLAKRCNVEFARHFDVHSRDAARVDAARVILTTAGVLLLVVELDCVKRLDVDDVLQVELSVDAHVASCFFIARCDRSLELRELDGVDKVRLVERNDVGVQELTLELDRERVALRARVPVPRGSVRIDHGHDCIEPEARSTET